MKGPLRFTTESHEHKSVEDLKRYAVDLYTHAEWLFRAHFGKRVKSKKLSRPDRLQRERLLEILKDELK